MDLIEKARIRQRFSAALADYDRQAAVQKQISRQLCDLLRATDRQVFTHILEIGCGTGNLTRLLAYHFSAEQWTLNDLCDTQSRLTAVLAGQNIRFHCGDGETLPFEAQYDLIASASAVQWFHHQECFIRRCAERLTANGLLLFSTFSPQNLYEIRELTGVGLNYPDAAQWQQWLSADFEILHCSQQQTELRFSSPLNVLRHLKQSGVTATQKQFWTKGKLAAFCQNYQKNYRTSDDKVHLTYTPMLFLARKRD